MSHSEAVPSLFCQRMSDLPSPLKSPAPMTCHDGPGLRPTLAPERMFRPFISQTAAVPSVFWNRMSDLPSPLKSPVPIACHVDFNRSEEHTSELQSPDHLVCRLLLEKKNTLPVP